MKKQNYGLYFALLASLLLSLMYMPGYNILQGDKEIYRYVGLVILKGEVPYRDVFDHKPPLIFFLNYASLLLGGDWGQWIIDAGLALLATGLFYRLCKRYKLAFPWLLPLLFNLMLRDYFICVGVGMTREYTAMFQLIFFCVLMGKHRHRYFLLGVLSSLIFFMQQDQVFALIPFFLFALLPDQDTLPFWSRVLRTALGFMAIALPIILFFALHGSLANFWQDAYLFNMTWYTTTLKESFGDHLRKLKTIFDNGNYEMPVLVAFTLGVCACFFPGRNKRLIVAALAAALLSLIPEFMGGRDILPNIHGMSFTHYVLPLSATLPILLFCVFAFTDEPVLQGWKAQGIFGFLACISLTHIALHRAAHPLPERDEPDSPIRVYLRQHPLKDYQLFNFGDNNYVSLYNEYRILAPSRWIYHHFYYLYEHWDKDHSMLRSIERDLQTHRTKYIIDSPRRDWFLDPSAYDDWHAFLVERYEMIPLPAEYGRTTLWKLKGTPD
jgi:hypothetical protein